MNYTISTTYVLKWQLKNAEHYKFNDSVCINTKTGKIIQQVINGRSKGYCINGKFKSINTLRKDLIQIPKEYCPF